MPKSLVQLPIQLAADLIFGNPRLKEILLFGQIYGLAHPRERVAHIKLRRESHALKAAVGDIFNVLLEAVRVHTEDSFGEDFLREGVLKDGRFFDEVYDVAGGNFGAEVRPLFFFFFFVF